MVELYCTYISAKKTICGDFKLNEIGIVKEIDNLGRIQIPKEIRKRLGLNNKVELVVTQNGLLIKSDEYTLVKIKES